MYSERLACKSMTAPLLPPGGGEGGSGGVNDRLHHEQILVDR